MRKDVPGSDSSLLVPSGVVGAGGTRARVLIEHLRAQIRALEQVPVSLANLPAPGAAPPRPACPLSSFPAGLFTSPLAGEVDRPKPLVAMAGREEGKQQIRTLPLIPLPGPPPQGRKGFLLSRLKRGGVHQIRPEAYRDSPAALSFALAILSEITASPQKDRDLILWCFTKKAAREWGRPYGPGLLTAGLDPAIFLIVEARNPQSAAWALEEGLKSGTLIAALAATEIRTEIAARRLGLAAQAADTPCLLLSSPRDANLPGTLTSWRIAAAKSGPARFDASAPGNPSWRLTLERCRGSAPGRSFILEFSYESFRLHIPAIPFNRAAEAGEIGKRRRAS